MRKGIISVIGLAVTACALSPHQQLAKTCANDGYAGKAYDDCVAKSITDYDHGTAIAHERTRQAEVKAALELNKAQCASLGFKSGAKGFADCMLKSHELQQQQNARDQSMHELKKLVRSCNTSRALDTGYGTTQDLQNRFFAAPDCSAAQVQAMELGLDPSKLITPIPVAKKPTQITCDTFHGSTTCTEW